MTSHLYNSLPSVFSEHESGFYLHLCLPIAILIAQINARLLKFPVNSILVDIAKGSYNSHKLLTAYRNSQPHLPTRGDLLSFSLKAFWICLRGLSPTPQKLKLGSPLWAPFLPSHFCTSTVRPEPSPQQLPSWGAAIMHCDWLDVGRGRRQKDGDLLDRWCELDQSGTRGLNTWHTQVFLTPGLPCWPL